MKPRTNSLIAQCVEIGIDRGWNRAHRKTDHPHESAIKAAIETAIMDEVHKWFAFDEWKLHAGDRA